MSRRTEESVTNLISLWLDMSRPRNQHNIDPKPVKWNSSVGYNVVNENISDKLNIKMQEYKIMLYSKKKVIDAKEKKLFTRKQKMVHKKQKKYLNKLADGMANIQTQMFDTHHAICKLDNILTQEQTETETETDNNNNNNNNN